MITQEMSESLSYIWTVLIDRELIFCQKTSYFRDFLSFLDLYLDQI